MSKEYLHDNGPAPPSWGGAIRFVNCLSHASCNTETWIGLIIQLNQT